MTQKAITIKDLAEKLNISVSTVSRALKDNPEISQQTRKTVQALAKELGYKKCILETGLKQPEAIRLYEKNGYKSIPNYGQYAGVENSVCYEKVLRFEM